MKDDAINTLSQAEANAKRFAKVTTKKDSIAYDRLSRFFHWYYFPDIKVFAPSKFVGLKNARLTTYEGQINGGKTEKALAKYFKELDKKSVEFERLAEKLDRFFKECGKEPNKSIRKPKGNGAIHVPIKNQNRTRSSLKKSGDQSNLITDITCKEGEVKSVKLTGYERNLKARKICIEKHGLRCFVCNFDFEEVYGKLGKGFIHVHHLKKISKKKQQHTVNPVKDMRPLCPNCHAMVHRVPKDSLPIEINVLKSKLAKRRA